MFNNITIMGRIATEVELKTTPSGKSVCSFRVAVERRYQKKDEDKKADFIPVVAWGASAEFISKYFSKGRMILINGELQSREYTDKEGKSRIAWEIVADRQSFTGEKVAGGQASTDAPQISGGQASPSFEEATDDDYPF